MYKVPEVQGDDRPCTHNHHLSRNTVISRPTVRFRQRKDHHVMPNPPAPKPDPGDVLVHIQEKIKVSDRQATNSSPYNRIPISAGSEWS